MDLNGAGRGNAAAYRICAGAVLTCALAAAGCAVPRFVWPQKDVGTRRIAGTAHAPRILLASRSSDYKEALVVKLTDGFRRMGMSVTVTGLDSLAGERAADYAVVVVINTCMARGMDRKVDAFLEAQPDLRNIIVFTTAGDPEWLPETEDRRFDAISGASVMAEVETKAFEIASKVNALVNLSDNP